MQSTFPTPNGIWLPLITPFRDGEVDETSLRRLVRHYATSSVDDLATHSVDGHATSPVDGHATSPVDGMILAATTGEAMTLDDDETRRLVMVARAELETTGRDIPLYLGLSGSDTREGVKALKHTEAWPIDGYLIACPYYTRPSQDGLFQHFSLLAGGTDRPILIYNIPYRTGVNLGNETMLRLAASPNIVGVKDCCADATQSFDLISARPDGFSVLTGDDALFHTALSQGADGGILASAHVAASEFASVRALMLAGDNAGALIAWRALVGVPRLLFTEPSPAPIKYWLWREGLIDSPELRLPMTPVSVSLAARIDHAVAQTSKQAKQAA